VAFVRTLDSYVLENSAEWHRLEELVDQANKKSQRLRGEDLDELLVRYQRTSAHLSHVRSTYADPQVTRRLTRVVAGARAVIYGSQPRAGGAFRTFFSSTFPAAVWSARWFIVVSALAFFLPAIATGVWIANSDAALDAAAPPALREAYINNDFEAYYSSAPAAEFATQVLVNNIYVSFLAFVIGIAWAVPTVLILAFNGANIGVAAGLFHAAGEPEKFWGLILPHGLLEITAILVAGGAGMQMGWALINPKDRSRSQSLVEEAQRAASIIIGLILVFITAGLIEGFVTPSPLDTWARISIGAAAFMAFWSYVFALGPQAVARGHTGSLNRQFPPD
jgi:uncharacterized membrane protein SpoIIM required for sporulation